MSKTRIALNEDGTEYTGELFIVKLLGKTKHAAVSCGTPGKLGDFIANVIDHTHREVSDAVEIPLILYRFRTFDDVPEELAELLSQTTAEVEDSANMAGEGVH